MNSNKGFTLIELIIVIAIMTLLAGSTIYGIGYIESANAKKCAYAINSGISSAKSQTMSKTEPSNMFLYGYNDGYYIKYSKEDTVLLNGDAKDISAGRVKITFDDGTELSNGVCKKIVFNRKDGMVLEGPNKITVSGSNTFVIKLIHSTGKNFVEIK